MLTASKTLALIMFSLHLNVFALRYSHKDLPVPLSYCTVPCRRKETGIKISFISPKMCAF